MTSPITDDPQIRWAKALGHPVRRSVVRQLGVCERLSPSELAAVLDMPIPNVAYHVRYLEGLGVIRLVARTQVRGRLQRQYTLVGREATVLVLARRERRRGLGDIGAAFRHARESRGVPVFELAGRVGIDAPQLERIEAGAVDSQLQLLFDLATALDSTLEEILAGVE